MKSILEKLFKYVKFGEKTPNRDYKRGYYDALSQCKKALIISDKIDLSVYALTELKNAYAGTKETYANELKCVLKEQEKLASSGKVKESETHRLGEQTNIEDNIYNTNENITAIAQSIFLLEQKIGCA